MKIKNNFILGILSLLLVFGFAGMAFCAEKDAPIQYKMSDVKVYGEDGDFGLKDKAGNVVVEAKYKKLIRIGNSSWLVQKGYKYGIMDSNGNYLVEPKYRRAERIFGKYAKLGNSSDFGLYDETGKAVIAPEYQRIEPMFGNIYLTCKKYKYGIVDNEGKELLPNVFDDLYMPDRYSLRVKYEGEWYQIEALKPSDIELPENVKKVTINDKEFKVTHLVSNTGFYALTASDYALKLVSSISPAYEKTIDDLLFSQGLDGVSIFIKLGWIPMFPFVYAKNYYDTYRTPNNGPLSDFRNTIKNK